MATFKTVLGQMRADGTRNVKIRIVAGKTNTLVSTAMYVTSKQLTRSGQIKDYQVLDACNAIISKWRDTIVKLGSAASLLSAKDLAHILKNAEVDIFRLNFIEHIREVAKTKRGQTSRNYCVMARSLERFSRNLDVNDITPQLLKNYEQWLRDADISPGTITQYMTLVRSAHNAARLQYNDEEAGVTRIPRQPFAKYKIPQPPVPVARGVDLETLQAIIDLEDEPSVKSRRNIARDCFALSFALGGMNYADIYSLPFDALKGDYIEYNRQKTRDARADDALYRVKVIDEIRPLLIRYRDPAKKRLFRFYSHYTTLNSFRESICFGMSCIEKILPYKRHYTFYAARHTYASLAYNVAKIDKYTVHELLNHSDKEMKITDRYIERDWQRLFDAHERIVRLVKWL
jgi:integrase